MLLANIFAPFMIKRPMCVMARGILERMFDPEHLNRLFAQTAEVGYTKKLHFATMVTLMGEVVLGVRPSVRAAYLALEASDDLVSLNALYQKLDRVEPVVSAALVRESAQQVAPAIDWLQATLPPWLPGYRCKILDGNHLSGTDHRIEELRTIWDAALPGKALVVLDQEHMVAEEVFLTEDGHAQERSLLPQVLQSIREKDLWIADRNFCTLGFLFGIARRMGYFVIRQHGAMKGKLAGKPRKKRRSDTGLVYEQAIVLTDPETGAEKKFRRITVVLDQHTRDGDAEIHILTNLPGKTVSAQKVAELYRRRWTIETAFQEITQTLECEIQTLGYPKAALFAFCLALVIYNAVGLLKASLRAVHGVEAVAEKLSGYYVALEISGAYDGMMIAIPEENWVIFRTTSVAKFVAILKEIASHVDLMRYRKCPRGPKKEKPQKKRYTHGGHASTYKLLHGIK
jgi:IS4 transposase